MYLFSISDASHPDAFCDFAVLELSILGFSTDILSWISPSVSM